MTSSNELPTSGEGCQDEAGADTLDLLTDAITSYVEEVDAYRSICLRYERTAGVYASPRALHVVQHFPYGPTAFAYIGSATERLPRLSKSLFWDSEGKGWMELLRDTNKRKGAESLRLPFLNQGIIWEGRPVLVHVASLQGERHLRVQLLLPPTPEELPAFPLRLVASALLCHEYLLPERIARALPNTTVSQPRCLSPREYLRRAMPQNLYASQCFLLGGAEN